MATTIHPFRKYVIKDFNHNPRSYYIKNHGTNYLLVVIPLMFDLGYKSILKIHFFSTKAYTCVKTLLSAILVPYPMSLWDVTISAEGNLFGYVYCKINKHNALNTFIWPGLGGKDLEQEASYGK